MKRIVCCQSHNDIKMYRSLLNNTYKNRRIHYKDLKSCVEDKWTTVKFVDIIIEKNEFYLYICCDNKSVPNTKKYFDVTKSHKRFGVVKDDWTKDCKKISECDLSFIRVTRELNEWHIGTFILEKLNILINENLHTTLYPNKSVSISLGVPIARIEEFYGVRGLN